MEIVEFFMSSITQYEVVIKVNGIVILTKSDFSYDNNAITILPLNLGSTSGCTYTLESTADVSTLMILGKYM